MNFDATNIQLDVKPITLDGMQTAINVDGIGSTSFSFALKKNRYLRKFHEVAAADYKKRRASRHMIKAENAAEIGAMLPTTGESLHAVVRGDFVLADIIPIMIGQAKSALRIATLGMSEGNAKMLRELIDAGLIESLQIHVSHYFASVDKSTTFLQVREILGPDIVHVSRNHAKIILCKTGANHFVLEGSANLRSSDNIEQFTIFNDAALMAFHEDWMNELTNLKK